MLVYLGIAFHSVLDNIYTLDNIISNIIIINVNIRDKIGRSNNKMQSSSFSSPPASV